MCYGDVLETEFLTFIIFVWQALADVKKYTWINRAKKILEFIKY